MPDSDDQIQAAAQAMRELSPDDRTRANDIARNVPTEQGFYFYFTGSGDARPASVDYLKGDLVAYYIGNPRPSGLAGVDQWGPRIPAWDPTCQDKELVWVKKGARISWTSPDDAPPQDGDYQSVFTSRGIRHPTGVDVQLAKLRANTELVPGQGTVDTRGKTRTFIEGHLFIGVQRQLSGSLFWVAESAKWLSCGAVASGSRSVTNLHENTVACLRSHFGLDDPQPPADRDEADEKQDREGLSAEAYEQSCADYAALLPPTEAERRATASPPRGAEVEVEAVLTPRYVPGVLSRDGALCSLDEGGCMKNATHFGVSDCLGLCDFHHADVVLSELTATQATLSVRTHEVGDLRGKLSKADELVTEFMRIRDTVAAQGAEWQASAAERADVIREQSNEIRELKRQLADAQDTLAVRTQEKANLGRALHDANCHVSSLIERRAKQKAEFAQTSSRLTADLAEESCAKSDALDKVSALTAGIGSLTDEVVTLEGDLHSRCTKLRKERDRVDELEKQLTAATIANDLAVSGNATIVTVLESVKAERDEWKASAIARGTRVAALRETVQELAAFSERDDLHKRIHLLADEMRKASVNYGEYASYYKPESDFHGSCRGKQAAYSEASQRIHCLIWESSPAPTPDRDSPPTDSETKSEEVKYSYSLYVSEERRKTIGVLEAQLSEAQDNLAAMSLKADDLYESLREYRESHAAANLELNDVYKRLCESRKETATARHQLVAERVAHAGSQRKLREGLFALADQLAGYHGFGKAAQLVRSFATSPADDEPAPLYDDCGKPAIAVAGYVFVGKQPRVDGGFYWYEESGLYWTTGGGPQLAPPFTIRSLSKSELATLASHFGAYSPPTDSQPGSSAQPASPEITIDRTRSSPEQLVALGFDEPTPDTALRTRIFKMGRNYLQLADHARKTDRGGDAMLYNAIAQSLADILDVVPDTKADEAAFWQLTEEARSEVATWPLWKREAAAGKEAPRLSNTGKRNTSGPYPFHNLPTPYDSSTTRSALITALLDAIGEDALVHDKQGIIVSRRDLIVRFAEALEAHLCKGTHPAF